MTGFKSLSLLLTLPLIVMSCSSGTPVESELEDPGAGLAKKGTLSVSSGSGQSARQLEALANTVRFRYVDGNGDPIVGALIRAETDSEAAEVSPSTVETNADGEAAFQWNLGYEYHNSLKASVVGTEGLEAVASAVATFRYFPPSPVSDGWPVRSLDETDPGVQRIFEGIDHIRRGAFTGIHSVVIAHKGEIVFETYFEGSDSQGRNWQWSRTTPHEQQSASKSFRSALIGIAIDRGFMSLETLVVDLFPEFDHLFAETKREITVKDFLTMSSGLEWTESGAAAGFSNNNLSAMYSLPQASWTEYLFSRPMAFSPGTHFEYNTGASLLLDDMVTRVSGMTRRNFVYSFYYDQIESSNTEGGPQPESGQLKTSREMAKLGQIYLDKGMWKQTRVVSESWVEDSFVEHMTPTTGVGYGYQWWMRSLTTPKATYRIRYAGGNGGQYIFVIDELDLVLVSTGGNFGSSLMNQFFTIAESYLIPAFE